MRIRTPKQWLGNMQLRNKIILMFIPLIVLPFQQAKQALQLTVSAIVTKFISLT